MHRAQRSTGTATAVAILLVGVGLAIAWLGIAPAVFGAGANAYLPSADAPVAAAAPVQEAAPLASGQAIGTNLQTSQPRDPFRPLIFEGDASSLAPGSGGRTGITFSVESITTGENPVVNVVVNGNSYQVGVGETFAGAYKVISITPPDEDAGTLGRAVFLFGDNSFEVVEGQEILK